MFYARSWLFSITFSHSSVHWAHTTSHHTRTYIFTIHTQSTHITHISHAQHSFIRCAIIILYWWKEDFFRLWVLQCFSYNIVAASIFIQYIQLPICTFHFYFNFTFIRFKYKLSIAIIRFVLDEKKLIKISCNSTFTTFGCQTFPCCIRNWLQS